MLPYRLAQGALPEHYRKGWEEKAKHGGSLIGEQVELPVRGFDGPTSTRVPTEIPTATPGATPVAPSAPATAGQGVKGGAGGALDSRWRP